jgi:hypothetical protein
MTITAPARHNRPTEYEIAWEKPNGQRGVFDHSARRTKGALLMAATTISRFIIDNATDPDAIPTYDRRTGWDFGGVRVFFTGGTAAHPTAPQQ